MKKLRLTISVLAIMVMLIMVLAPSVAFADTEDAGLSEVSAKALASAGAIAVAAFGGAIAMGFATAKTTDAIARQPEAADKISSRFMLGLVFIETAIIYALLVVILIIFVL